jgi:hypothetical protein
MLFDDPFHGGATPARPDYTMTFDVHVTNDEKRPQSGCSVEVYLPESFPLLPDDAKITEYTDEDGRARFEKADAGFGEVTIYVSGENKGRFDLEDGAEFAIVI